MNREILKTIINNRKRLLVVGALISTIGTSAGACVGQDGEEDTSSVGPCVWEINRSSNNPDDKTCVPIATSVPYVPEKIWYADASKVPGNNK